MKQISRIGLDTSKAVFTLHGVNESGEAVLRVSLRRAQMMPFFRRHVWGWIAEPIWASGHAAAPTGRTHDRNRTARQISDLCSCIRGAVHTCERLPVTASEAKQSRASKASLAMTLGPGTPGPN